jgi:hypothetical protein
MLGKSLPFWRPAARPCLTLGTRSMEPYSVYRSRPDRAYQRQLTRAAILILFDRRWTVSEHECHRPSISGRDLAKLAYLFIRHETTIRT